MAKDPKGVRVTFNYAKGAATMTRGLADALFGVTWRGDSNTVPEKTVTVKAHQRVRVIGQPAKAVGAYSYTFKQYPTMDAEQAMGGQAVTVTLASGDSWTVRVSGGMADFCDWFKGKLTATNVNVRSGRGTVYGPFGTGAIT